MQVFTLSNIERRRHQEHMLSSRSDDYSRAVILNSHDHPVGSFRFKISRKGGFLPSDITQVEGVFDLFGVSISLSESRIHLWSKEQSDDALPSVFQGSYGRMEPFAVGDDNKKLLIEHKKILGIFPVNTIFIKRDDHLLAAVKLRNSSTRVFSFEERLSLDETALVVCLYYLDEAHRHTVALDAVPFS